MLPCGLVRRGHVQALRPGEQPVQTDCREPVVLDGPAGLLSPGGRDFHHGRRQRERGDLDAMVAQPGRGGRDLGHGPILEHLITESELHRTPIDYGLLMMDDWRRKADLPSQSSIILCQSSIR
jgi:hypothetical protein